ncbi:MAG TPA: hypothetical protein VMT46_16700 [Anaerolineaceae bacterium]|nr:hypothetical protein [Anaerolineaceae bacterium]
MDTSKPFQVRFHYSRIYSIFFCLFFILTVAVSVLAMIGEAPVAFVLSSVGIAIFTLYLIYESTKTLLVDEKGIAEWTLFGEDLRIGWNEISGMKSSGFFDPGIKVICHNGDCIKISKMVVNYDFIIELIRQKKTDLWGQPPAFHPDQPVYQPTTNLTGDLVFKAPVWAWLIIPVLVPFSAYMFFAALPGGNLLYILFGAFLLFIACPILIWQFLHGPVRIETQGEYLWIYFRVKQLRKPIRVHARSIENITFKHKMAYSQHGAHPTTNLTIHLPQQIKISVSNWNVSDEEMYIRLGDWLEKYHGE